MQIWCNINSFQVLINRDWFNSLIGPLFNCFETQNITVATRDHITSNVLIRLVINVATNKPKEEKG